MKQSPHRIIATLLIAALLAGGCASSSTPPTAPAPAAGQTPSSPSAGAPRPIANQKPIYPEMAKRSGQQGKVIVRVLVDTQGHPSQARVHTSSGYPMLDQAAVESVSKWQFVPGRRNGVLEAMEFNVPITYSLN